MHIIVSIMLLAVAHRVRGGFMPTGSTTLARSFYAVAVGLVCALYTPAEYIALPALAILLCFAGLALIGHSDHQDMGEQPSGYSKDGQPNEIVTGFLPIYDMTAEKWYRETIDFIGLAVIGICRTALIFAPFALINPIIMIFSIVGICHGFAYLIAKKIKPVFGGSFDGQYMERGEILAGAFQSVTLISGLLYIFR